ncbi:hypothetical protein PS421_09380 [Pediococcus pentosaceus]|uniref:hypothetical protein n=1 Tax=Pediococcus pentosaceus TaxID=1255 RepID=UPI002F264CAA
MTTDLLEPAIPINEIIQVFKKAKYSEYLSSEYEGNRLINDRYEVNSVEQVKRHQTVLKDAIND